MSALEVFADSRWTIRTEERDGEVWFVGRDVCAALGIANARDALAALDADEKGVASTDTPGGAQQVTTVTESGLYALVLRSRKPEAREFRRWVTGVVLPSIRRTGRYDMVAERVAEVPSHAESLRGWADAVERAERAEFEVERLAPQAAMAMALIDSSGDYSVRDAAHILERDHGIDIGSKRLFSFLRTIGWIDKGKRPRPYQAQLTLGRLAVLSSTFVDSDGESHITTQVRITPKGLAELHRRLGGGPDLALVPGGNQ